MICRQKAGGLKTNLSYFGSVLYLERVEISFVRKIDNGQHPVTMANDGKKATIISDNSTDLAGILFGGVSCAVFTLFKCSAATGIL